MGERLRQWRALPSAERRQLLLFAVVQPGISLSLRVRGLRRTQAWLERHSQRSEPHSASDNELAAAQRTAELAAIAGLRGPFSATCLRQALAVYWMLRRRNLQPHLRLGVARIGPTPTMHAWVELSGIPLAQPSTRYLAFRN